MIHVRMTDQNGIQSALCLDCRKIGNRIFRSGLPDSTVHKNPFPGYIKIDAAAADFHSAAQKVKFHIVLPFSY